MTCKELIRDIPLSNTIRDDVLELFEKFVFYTHDGEDIRSSSGKYNDKIFSYGDYNIYISKYIFKSKKIIKDKKKKINDINVRDLRNCELKKNNKCVKSIVQDIYGVFNHGLLFEKEVVVLIEDREFYLKCCKKIVDLLDSGTLTKSEREECLKHLNKTHFRLDLYNPDYGINIEHDGSKYHEKEINKLFDESRDLYLKTIYPNMIIIRVLDYMIYIKSTKEYYVDVSKKDELISNLTEITNESKLSKPMLMDFGNEIFIEFFKMYLIPLKRISEKLNSGYTIEELINLNDEDLLSIDYHNNKPK